MFPSLCSGKERHSQIGKKTEFYSHAIIRRLSLLNDTKIVFSNNQLYDKLSVYSCKE